MACVGSPKSTWYKKRDSFRQLFWLPHVCMYHNACICLSTHIWINVIIMKTQAWNSKHFSWNTQGVSPCGYYAELLSVQFLPDPGLPGISHLFSLNIILKNKFILIIFFPSSNPLRTSPSPSPPKCMMFSPHFQTNKQTRKQQTTKVERDKIKKKARQEITNKKHIHKSNGVSVLVDCSWAWAFPGVWLINPGTLHWRK